MSKPSADWIKTKQDLTTYCERCGKEFAPRLPIDISTYVTVVKAFAKEHRKCREKVPQLNRAT